MIPVAELKEFGEFNCDFVRDALNAGETIEQFVAEWSVLLKYQGYATPAANERGQWRSNAEVVWAGK